MKKKKYIRSLRFQQLSRPYRRSKNLTSQTDVLPGHSPRVDAQLPTDLRIVIGKRTLQTRETRLQTQSSPRGCWSIAGWLGPCEAMYRPGTAAHRTGTGE